MFDFLLQFLVVFDHLLIDSLNVTFTCLLAFQLNFQICVFLSHRSTPIKLYFQMLCFLFLQGEFLLKEQQLLPQLNIVTLQLQIFILIWQYGIWGRFAWVIRLYTCYGAQLAGISSELHLWRQVLDWLQYLISHLQRHFPFQLRILKFRIRLDLGSSRSLNRTIIAILQWIFDFNSLLVFEIGADVLQ